MGKRPKRRIVLVLVEGKSDREALQIAISELFDRIDSSIEVFFPIIRDEDEDKGGDITTTYYVDKRHKKKWIRPDNIEDAIYTLFLEDFFDKEKIMPKDITEIIQLVDTDGAYIPDDHIFQDDSLTKDESPKYFDTRIDCISKENIEKRNEQKRKNLDYLSSCSQIKVKQKTVPYSIYYFSCNLDHFLHHAPNLEDRMKRELADIFSRKYIGKADEFAQYIIDDPAAINDKTYAESWDYIKEYLNSLQRHTNINILFKKLVEA